MPFLLGVHEIWGRDPFNQNFRKFRSKPQWIGLVQPESFKKAFHLSRWTTFLGWTSPIEMDRSTILTHFSIPVPRCSVSSMYKRRKILTTALLWIVNRLYSGSLGVTRASVYSYDRSVVAAKCMFWLLTALKDDLFPERICNVFFIRHSIRRLRTWCLKSHGKYLGTVCSK